MPTTTIPRTRFFTLGASARIFETKDGQLHLTNRWIRSGDRLELGAPRRKILGSREVLVVPNALPATQRQRWLLVDELALTSEELASLMEMWDEHHGLSKHDKSDRDRLFGEICGRDMIPA